ncbi:MAG TPA: hypothetical protein VMI31_02210 [Fimbriimonadaceae bacterium]|nr:hypothetical protein [Fimbriimonadaceae bacterium]
MPELAEVWNEALPTIKNGLTGVGIWTALNLAKPITLEDGSLVIGLPHSELEFSGHLRLPATRRMIEVTVAGILGSPINLRVIDGTEYSDWELEKRRDVERRRLNEQLMAKERAELTARASWEHTYEQLGRKYAAISVKSLPQNRARFYQEAVAMLADARRLQSNWDDMGERNFARCVERLAQYAEIPSTLVAIEVLEKAGEL